LTDCVDGVGDTLGVGDGVVVVCETAGELELFGCVVQAVPIANVAMRPNKKVRDSKLIAEFSPS
jgi:hypothetical protein